MDASWHIIMIFPSIDLMNGKVVQLVGGRKENKRIEINDVLGVAKRYSKYTLQVIDLDAAMGTGDNLKIVKAICAKYRCRVGGGIRDVDRAREIVRAGAKRIIIGSAAFKGDDIDLFFLKQLNKFIGKDKIIIALDSKDGRIVIKGWKKSTNISPLKIIKRLEPFCLEFLYTYVDKEGLMEGTDFGMLRKIKYLTTNEVTAAGGIASNEEIDKLERLGVNSVLGMALYTGNIKLA
jgi:phosphoribosylformimino-5-aminoimidazole carboxamide ribotide isomerase